MKIDETLNHIRSRPRFKLETELSQDEFKKNLLAILNQQKEHYSGLVSRDVSTFWVKTPENPYWKPRLTLVTEANTETKNTTVRGIFGPSQAVWTFFIFLYVILSVCIMVFFTIWYLPRSMGSHEYGWALYILLLSIFMVAMVYIATRFAQHKSKDEIQLLRDFAEMAAATKITTKEASQ